MANMSELKVKPSELRSKANEFKTKSNTIQNKTNAMLTLIKGINGTTWSGDAANSFKAQFQKLEEDMNQMHSIINEYATDLETIAQKYETTENQNEQIAKSLQTDVITM